MKLRKFKLILDLGLGRIESFTYEEAKELITKDKQAMSGIKSEVETPDHVLKCKHGEMIKVRNQLMNEVRNKVKSCDTYPLLYRWILILLCQWLGDFPMSYPTTECTAKIKEAILEQENLGIGNMLRGILSMKWGEIQKKSKDSNEMNVTDTWSGEIAHIILVSFSCQMWKTRCQYIHLMKNGTSESEYR